MATPRNGCALLEHQVQAWAGYRIALKDLEIRGAGDLLEDEQSGHAQAVGFDLYLRWLEEMVRALRGRAASGGAPTGGARSSGAFPDGFVPDEELKLDLYRRLARAVTSGEIDALRDRTARALRAAAAPAESATRYDPASRHGSRARSAERVVRGDEARLHLPSRHGARLAGFTSLTRRRPARRGSTSHFSCCGWEEDGGSCGHCVKPRGRS